MKYSPHLIHGHGFLILLMALILPLSAQSEDSAVKFYQPGFSCDNIKPGRVEYVICTSKKTSAADVKLNQLYRLWRALNNEQPQAIREQILNEQRHFLRQRNACYTHGDKSNPRSIVNCVFKRYFERNKALYAKISSVEPFAFTGFDCTGAKPFSLKRHICTDQDLGWLHFEWLETTSRFNFTHPEQQAAMDSANGHFEQSLENCDKNKICLSQAYRQRIEQIAAQIPQNNQRGLGPLKTLIDPNTHTITFNDLPWLADPDSYEAQVIEPTYIGANPMEHPTFKERYPACDLSGLKLEKYNPTTVRYSDDGDYTIRKPDVSYTYYDLGIVDDNLTFPKGASLDSLRYQKADTYPFADDRRLDVLIENRAGVVEVDAGTNVSRTNVRKSSSYALSATTDGRCILWDFDFGLGKYVYRLYNQNPLITQNFDLYQIDLKNPQDRESQEREYYVVGRNQLREIVIDDSGKEQTLYIDPHPETKSTSWFDKITDTIYPVTYDISRVSSERRSPPSGYITLKPLIQE